MNIIRTIIQDDNPNHRFFLDGGDAGAKRQQGYSAKINIFYQWHIVSLLFLTPWQRGF